jgi:hypothetical protein
MFSVMRALGRRIRNVVAECNYAQRRLAILQGGTDRYLPQPGQAPDSYEAFLFRTSGPLTHEPSAAQRSSGRLVG